MQTQDLTNYAVQILQHLREHQDVQPSTIIAETIGIGYPTFAKIALRLRKKGLIIAIQGRNGGYVLGKPTCEISFYDVHVAIEGEPWISYSLKNSRRCADSERYTSKTQEFLQSVQDKMIAEMTDKRIVDLV